MVSTNRGNHFIFEDNTFEWANSVGLDIGNEDWGASRPPQPVGFDVVRGNTFRYCGIEGLGGTGGPQSTLVEKNLFEWIGWQDAAMMSESGGTKMHTARNLLFRNNVVRHIRHANGIWLDIGNANDRLTGNVFADIPGDVNPHAIHIEGSNELNEIDNNIFDHLTGGILIRDTNNVIVAYNLFLDCTEVCVDTVSGINGPRPVGGHTNDVHNLMVHDNVFFKIGPLGHRVQQRAQRGGWQRVSGVGVAVRGRTVSAREVSRAGGVAQPGVVARRVRVGHERSPGADHGALRSGQAGADFQREGRCEAGRCIQGDRRGLLWQAGERGKNAGADWRSVHSDWSAERRSAVSESCDEQKIQHLSFDDGYRGSLKVCNARASGKQKRADGPPISQSWLVERFVVAEAGQEDQPGISSTPRDNIVGHLHWEEPVSCRVDNQHR